MHQGSSLVSAIAQATPDRPWLGLAHFTAADQPYFYGRDSEIRELTDRVRRAPLTVLYGLSGYGKSSLLGAGLIPALTADGHKVTLLRRCYDDLEHRPLSADIIAAVRADWGDLSPPSSPSEGDFTSDGAATLWEFYHDRRRPWFQTALDTDEFADSPPVLLLDQFEEIFIKGEDRSTGNVSTDARVRRAALEFREQLADLVENRPPAALRRQLESGTAAEKRTLIRRYDFQSRPVRVAIALRDDFLARFERWRRDMPSLMEHRIELRLLSGPQAYQAVFEPGTKRPHRPPIIPARVAEAIVCAAAGATPGTPLEEIDAVPPILSLLCERLNDRRLAVPFPPDSIQETDFSPGEAARILGAFFEDKLVQHPKAVREYLEDELVSDSGFRENVTLESALATLRDRAGIGDADTRLRQLVDDRILVIENRGGMARVEFTHDTLAKLALDRRAERIARRRRVKAVAWTTASLLVAGLSLGLTGWAMEERTEAKKATVKAMEEAGRADRALANASRQLERSQLEEGRAWLERAKVAQGKGDHLTAIMLGGRAVGFQGYGRKVKESHLFEEQFPLLLGRQMQDPIVENERRVELAEVHTFISSHSPTFLPLWSSPFTSNHIGPVTSVAFSPDGRQLASGSVDGSIKLWDTASGKELKRLEGHTKTVNSVAFSPDGSRIASGSADHTIRLWNVAGGQEIRCLEGHTDPVTSVAFSPDGGRIASGSWDTTIKLWDVATGLELRRLEEHTSWVNSVAFSPDGRHLASASSDLRVMVWDEQSGEVVSTFNDHSDNVTSVAFSPDGRRLASASADQTIKLWDRSSDVLLLSLRGHSGEIYDVEFSPDGRQVASASADHTIRLWDVGSGQEARRFESHIEGVSSVAYSPDGHRLASASLDDTVKLWDTVKGTELKTAGGHQTGVQCVAFSPDGSRMASGSSDQTIRLWDAVNGHEMYRLEGHTDRVTSIAFSPDGSQIASGSLDSTIKLWNVASGQEVQLFVGHENGVTGVNFSPDGLRLASSSKDRTIKLWDSANGQELLTMEGHIGFATCVVFSPDGSRLASTSDDKTIKLWDATSGRLLGSLSGHELSVTHVAFAPDGNWLASASRDATIKLWDSTSGRELGSLQGHTKAVSSLAFSSDGSRLASASWDSKIKLWDPISGQELVSLEGHSEEVTSVAFSPDGSRLVSASEDHTIKLWDAAQGHQLGSLQGHMQGVTCAVFSPDGYCLASASLDDTIKLWDASSGRELGTLKGHTDRVTCVTFSPDGRRLASASLDKTIKLWDATTGQELITMRGHTGALNSVAFAPDGRHLASASRDTTVKLWDAASGREKLSLEGHTDHVTNVAFSPDGKRLVSVSWDRFVKFWNTTDGRLLSSTQVHASGLTSVAFSPEGSRVVTASRDHTIKIWSLTPDQVLTSSQRSLSLRGHSGEVNSVTFSPDGKRLASAFRDNTIKLWDATSGRELTSLKGHIGEVNSVAFSPDGQRLASASDDKLVYLWDVASVGGEQDETSPAGVTSINVGHTANQPFYMKSISVDLAQRLRLGLVALQSRHVIAPSVNDSILSNASFPVLPVRNDTLGKLANPALQEDKRSELQMQFIAECGQAQAGVALWQRLKKGSTPSPVVRRVYLSMLIRSVRNCLSTDPAQSAVLLEAIVQATNSEILSMPTISLSMMALVSDLIMMDAPERQLETAALLKLLFEKAPLAWLEALSHRVANGCERNSAATPSYTQCTQILKDLVDQHPNNLVFVRHLLQILTSSDLTDSVAPEVQQENLEATAAELISASFAASIKPSQSTAARGLLRQTLELYSDHATVHYSAGWILFNLNDPPAALNAFVAAGAILKSEQKTNPELLVGLSLAQWLNQQQPEAIATYKQLIEAGRAQQQFNDWADRKTLADLTWPRAETKPLDDLLTATLAKFPNLAPATATPDTESQPEN